MTHPAQLPRLLPRGVKAEPGLHPCIVESPFHNVAGPPAWPPHTFCHDLIEFDTLNTAQLTAIWHVCMHRAQASKAQDCYMSEM